ncbi:hypothetical protein SISNIDRAFT_475274 [Sistotremastrum niveocremeum HHB9708]|uniref:DUF6570 domain-containing protein n=1 Tax=Sistotremastrum niveocremeum HHB9708 TaxID=1314777 RepID=A0A164RS59_9AGAM|nr:hypothetical protein SISNIDRAFT_475274 [Sistotremastrum niveocremeum HHB9708]
MISRCRAKSWIIHLKEDGELSNISFTQRGMKGNIIVFPQRPDRLLDILPPSVDDIITPICVVFVGSCKPSKVWLKNNAKPLVVRREKVRRALQWLQRNNPLYSDVRIDHELLNSLEPEHMFDFHVEHRADPGHDTDVLVARYDTDPAVPNATADSQDVFNKVVITDIDGRASVNEMRAAALRHMKIKGGSFIQFPHENTPVNEFFNPDLFPMLYPTLFPYGIGGFEDQDRPTHLSFDRQVKHFCNLQTSSSVAHENQS